MRVLVRKERKARRGAALAYTMMLFVTVTVTGATLLSVNALYYIQLAHFPIMSRLRAATENALEMTRGRFTLVAGTQEDWNTLLPNSGWNTIQTVTIDSCSVVVSGQNVGTTNAPRCQLRAVGTLSGRQWACLYEFRQTSFGDFAMYVGGTNTQSIPSHMHFKGSYYSKPSINMNNETDIHFYKSVATSGSVVSPENATFAQGYTENLAQIDFQPNTSFTTAKSAAAAANTHYSNTQKIQLRGNVYRRWYSHKTGNNSYTYQWSGDITIPNGGVIYIEEDGCPTSGMDANVGFTNTQDLRDNQTGFELYGWLDGVRVTIYCEDDKVTVTDNITYQTLMNNPNLRRVGEKESPAARSMAELLGVVCKTDLQMQFTSFTALPNGQKVTDNSAYTAYNGVVWNDVGHQATQHAVDGVFVAYGDAENRGNLANNNNEWFVCGGIITGSGTINNLFDMHYRNNIDWDWQLESQDPPMMIKTYNYPPQVISGTFRSYAP